MLKERKNEAEENQEQDEVPTSAQIEEIESNTSRRNKRMIIDNKVFSLLNKEKNKDFLESFKGGNFKNIQTTPLSPPNTDAPLTSRETWLSNWLNSGVR